MKKVLGKGLNALFPEEDMIGPPEKTVIEVDINKIEPNMEQPRKSFDAAKIGRLAESIRAQGVVQPLLVKKYEDGYKIIAGERRWRASREAGLKKIPVIIREATDRNAMEIALIENLLREDLNPIEEAGAYEKLIEEHGLTQEAIAELVGKSRPAITNYLRLLKLSEKIKNMVAAGELTGGHARALLSVSSEATRDYMASEMARRGMSVREAENYAILMEKRSREKPLLKRRDVNEEKLEDDLGKLFGTKVRLQTGKKKGKIVIEYYSPAELDRIIEMLEKLSTRRK